MDWAPSKIHLKNLNITAVRVPSASKLETIGLGGSDPDNNRAPPYDQGQLPSAENLRSRRRRSISIFGEMFRKILMRTTASIQMPSSAER
jgi:hypothetical protein